MREREVCLFYPKLPGEREGTCSNLLVIYSIKYAVGCWVEKWVELPVHIDALERT